MNRDGQFGYRSPEHTQYLSRIAAALGSIVRRFMPAETPDHLSLARERGELLDLLNPPEPPLPPVTDLSDYRKH